MRAKWLLPCLFILSFTIFSPAASFSTSVPPTHTEPDPATVRAAVEGFKALSNKEKRVKLKQAKKELKAFKKAKRKGADPDTNTLLLVIIAILLPPLAVYLHQGEINNKFWITLLLWILGIIGGFFLSWFALLAAIVYALIVVLGKG